ncbi:hypothetical protein [Streptomyces sp. MJM1172]|uniref:hypothetical protein n=1 Tax=Streptomyces sp. MJM1172 TaxID=1703926 RepID=UPI00093E76FA|nr:hypothetical protein [Streptomyces sp. MJM1172]
MQEGLGVAPASLRAGLAAAASQLDEPGALRPGLSVPEATDVLWYFLGHGSYFTLTGNCRWPFERSAQWLYERLATLLIDRGAG